MAYLGERNPPPGPPPLPRCNHCRGTVAYGRCDCPPGEGRYAPQEPGCIPAPGELVETGGAE